MAFQASSDTPPEISAKQAILVNGTTGEVLFEKKADEKAYPASTTKIITALVTLETLKRWNADIDQKVRIPESAADVEGSSIYLNAGEEVSIKDLLYGLMLRSGNDAAVALAEIIGGNTANFVQMMNEKAQALGCANTNFMNPNGLYDKNHYTTVREMAWISMEAMKNETFREIASARSWQAGRQPDKYNYFYNKNKVVFQYQGGTGIKIGYTEKSGRTLVASAEREGVLLICVVMNAPDWFRDAYALLNYGFEEQEN
jgi:D-alanyl-D-alanine carboxypeptidase (penicillin-binding protein 5/6)